MMAAAGPVLAWLSERQGEMADFLESLVRAESPSLVPGSEVPGLRLLATELEQY